MCARSVVHVRAFKGAHESPFPPGDGADGARIGIWPRTVERLAIGFGGRHSAVGARVARGGLAMKKVAIIAGIAAGIAAAALAVRKAL